MKFKRVPVLKNLFLFLLIVSCTDTLYFDQINIDVDPIFNGPTVYFELNQNDFFDEASSTEISLVSDITNYLVLQSSEIRENLTRVIFDFEISNKFDRSFEISVNFLNGDGNIVHSLPGFNIAPGDLNYTSRSTIDIADFPLFLNSRKVSVEVRLLPSGDQIDPAIFKTLKFRSAGTFYLSF